MVVFWQAAVQTKGGGVVGPRPGSYTWSTEALRCIVLRRAANGVCSFREGVVCSLRRGLISGIMLLVNVACREGRPTPGEYFLSFGQSRTHGPQVTGIVRGWYLAEAASGP